MVRGLIIIHSAPDQTAYYQVTLPVTTPLTSFQRPSVVLNCRGGTNPQDALTPRVAALLRRPHGRRVSCGIDSDRHLFGCQ